MNNFHEGHINYDFKPDNQWDIWYFNHHEIGYHSTPSPGWIIQVETRFNLLDFAPIDNQPPASERDRVIVIADFLEDIGLLTDATDANNYWKAVPRDTPPPTEDELKTAWHEWKAQP